MDFHFQFRTFVMDFLRGLTDEARKERKGQREGGRASEWAGKSQEEGSLGSGYLGSSFCDKRVLVCVCVFA